MAKKTAAKKMEDNITAKTDEDVPEDIAQMKAELESKTGKKYRYRKPKKDMPSIQDLLFYGDTTKPREDQTWWELFSFPVYVSLLFVVVFVILSYALPPSTREKHKLPKMGKQKMKPPPMPELQMNQKPPMGMGAPDAAEL